MHKLNWDNLRFVLSVANHGSIAAAARELEVNRTTVLRRINSFQEELQCRIFERMDSGYVLTPEAEKMIEAAREVETTLFHMQRQVVGRELSLEGEIRLTTTETFMSTILGPILASFHQRHPRIVVDVLVTNSVLSLKRRDADIALRPTAEPDPDMVGREIGKVNFGVYASHDYLAQHQQTGFDRHQWIGYDAGHGGTPLKDWFDARVPKDRIVLRSDSFAAMRVAAEHHLGLALIPRFLGERSAILTRVPADTDNLSVGLWLLTHPDLIRSARVHAFIEHLRESIPDSD